MSLTKEELLHLAKLARLRMDERELETFQPQLDGILDYISQLQSLELPAATEVAAPTEATVREDVPMPSSQELLEALRAAFPDRADLLMRVPAVFEKSKD